MRLVLITAAAVLTMTVGANQRASAQPEANQPPPASLQPANLVPPTVTPTATTDPVEAVASIPRSLTDLTGNTDSPRVITLDFAQLDTNAAMVSARGPIGQILDTIAYWFNSIVTAVTNGLTPPSPESFAKSVKSKDVNNLWRLVGDAGYKINEISTDVGVMPDVSFKFKYIRELSDGDINWLERKLVHHARLYKDPISVIQRMIIYTLLNINSSDTYFVSELQVKLLPLPKVQFTLEPWDRGLSPDQEKLLRAIQGKAIVRHKPAEEDSRY